MRDHDLAQRKPRTANIHPPSQLELQTELSNASSNNSPLVHPVSTLLPVRLLHAIYALNSK